MKTGLDRVQITYLCLVRKAGFEPARLAAPDPKSGASANSATLAFVLDLNTNGRGAGI